MADIDIDVSDLKLLNDVVELGKGRFLDGDFIDVNSKEAEDIENTLVAMTNYKECESNFRDSFYFQIQIIWEKRYRVIKCCIKEDFDSLEEKRKDGILSFPLAAKFIRVKCKNKRLIWKIV